MLTHTLLGAGVALLVAAPGDSFTLFTKPVRKPASFCSGVVQQNGSETNRPVFRPSLLPPFSLGRRVRGHQVALQKRQLKLNLAHDHSGGEGGKARHWSCQQRRRSEHGLMRENMYKHKLCCSSLLKKPALENGREQQATSSSNSPFHPPPRSVVMFSHVFGELSQRTSGMST